MTERSVAKFEIVEETDESGFVCYVLKSNMEPGCRAGGFPTADAAIVSCVLSAYADDFPTRRMNLRVERLGDEGS